MQLQQAFIGIYYQPLSYIRHQNYILFISELHYKADKESAEKIV